MHFYFPDLRLFYSALNSIAMHTSEQSDSLQQYELFNNEDSATTMVSTIVADAVRTVSQLVWQTSQSWNDLSNVKLNQQTSRSSRFVLELYGQS